MLDCWIDVTTFYFQFTDMNQTQYSPEYHEKYILVLIWHVMHAYLAEKDLLFNPSHTYFILVCVKI